MTRTAILVLACLLSGPAAATRVLDDAGRTLVFERPPARIVSLAPHLTELLFAAGAGAQVVGVDSASDYPPAARRIAQVGDSNHVNLERVLGLKPDLVVVWAGGNRAADVHALEKLGLRVLRTRTGRLDDVGRLLRLLGRASGHAAQGEAAADGFSQKLAALQVPFGAPAVDVFYQVWDRPLMTVGGRHWISDALTLCGARNVFHDLGPVSAVVSHEAVLKRSPGLIMGGSDAPDLRRSWQRFGGIPAVRRGAFVRVDADRLHRLSPRVLDGVAEVCAAVAAYR